VRGLAMALTECFDGNSSSRSKAEFALCSRN
jgi:hypothetical protein